jgi:hypothetical protein
MDLAAAQVTAVQIMNEYSTGGNITSVQDGNYKDLVYRMPPLANTSQQELAKIIKIPGKHSISRNVIPNQLSLQSYDEKQHFPGTDDSYTATGAKSFSIEVDGACTIYFYETISGVLTALNGTYSKDGGTATAFTGSIAVTGITTFSNYKGLLTIASATNTITMKVVATYPLKSRYRALFAYTFATALTVPLFKAYVPYDFPDDFQEFDKLIRAYDQRQYKEFADFLLTPDKKIHISYLLNGQFDIHYWKKPTVITNTTATTYEFEVNEDAQALIPWFMAAYAIMPDNASLGVQLLNQYYELKNSLRPNENTQSGSMVTIAGGEW